MTTNFAQTVAKASMQGCSSKYASDAKLVSNKDVHFKKP